MTWRKFAVALLMLLSGAAGSALAQESGYLGVQLNSVTGTFIDYKAKKVSTWEGASVERVVANSPAAAAGLKEGDVILSVDGHETKDESEVTNLVKQMSPGLTAHLKLKRDRAYLELKVVIGKRPETPPANLGAQPDQHAPVSCRDKYDPSVGCY
jgi:S1-C subfamily serine protease